MGASLTPRCHRLAGAAGRLLLFRPLSEMQLMIRAESWARSLFFVVEYRASVVLGALLGVVWGTTRGGVLESQKGDQDPKKREPSFPPSLLNMLSGLQSFGVLVGIVWSDMSHGQRCSR